MFCEFTDISAKPLKPLLSGLRTLQSYKFILFHYTDGPPADDLPEAVSFIRRYHHARVIVFAPKSPATSLLFEQLLNVGLRELVETDNETDLLAELEDCISHNGRGFSDVAQLAADAKIELSKSLVKPALLIPEGFRLIAGIAGAFSRSGCTTQTFGLYHALKEWGFIPCIVDQGQTFIENLMRLYPRECEIDGSCVTIRGISFSHDILSGTEHNAYLFDYGCLSQNTYEQFANCSLRLLCAGAKPWELPELAMALQAFPTASPQHLLLSFASAGDMEDISPYLGELPPAAYPPWQPDIWVGDAKWHSSFLIDTLSGLMEPQP